MGKVNGVTVQRSEALTNPLLISLLILSQHIFIPFLSLLAGIVWVLSPGFSFAFPLPLPQHWLDMGPQSRLKALKTCFVNQSPFFQFCFYHIKYFYFLYQRALLTCLKKWKWFGKIRSHILESCESCWVVQSSDNFGSTIYLASMTVKRDKLRPPLINI